MNAQIVVDHREALRERWQQAKSVYRVLALSAHQALCAIQAEEEAEVALAKIIPSDTCSAYTLCDALADLARALEAWAYVNARLWNLCETGQADAEITALHYNSTEQYRRILAAHLHTQEQTFHFCQRHQIVLRFGVITQAFNRSDTKTPVFLREEATR